MPTFHKSNVGKYKYYVISPLGYKIHFGHKDYQHYKDKTGLGIYSYLDHKDKKRRDLYRKRHSKILTKDGKPAYLDKEQPSFYSWHYLW